LDVTAGKWKTCPIQHRQLYIKYDMHVLDMRNHCAWQALPSTLPPMHVQQNDFAACAALPAQSSRQQTAHSTERTTQQAARH
jgi:hypothetical protein